MIQVASTFGQKLYEATWTAFIIVSTIGLAIFVGLVFYALYKLVVEIRDLRHLRRKALEDARKRQAR